MLKDNIIDNTHIGGCDNECNKYIKDYYNRYLKMCPNDKKFEETYKNIQIYLLKKNIYLEKRIKQLEDIIKRNNIC